GVAHELASGTGGGRLLPRRASDDRREQRVDVEQNEGLVVAHADGLDQPRVYAGKLRPGGDRPLGHLEEVEDLSDREPVAALPGLQQDDRALVGGPGGRGEETGTGE